MASKIVKIGFVGTGGIAQAHINRLVEIPEAKIVALCDIDAARVKTVADPLGAAVYTDGAKMLADVKLDALYVCVPPHAHGEIEVRAAQKGIHIFVEKPVNLFLDKAKQAWKEIKKNGVLTQSGYSLRYTAGGVQLKKFLEDKTIATANVIRWSGLPGTPWWRKYDQAGGQLVEMTTHQVDLIRWVMGDVDAVSASYSFGRVFKDQPEVTVPDSQAALLIFKSGASATVNTACALGKGWGGGTDFVIKDAKVVFKAEGCQIVPEDAYKLPAPPLETPSIDAAFVRAIASDQPTLLRSPYDDALKSAAVTLACNKSAEQGGKLVKLDDFLGEL
ncbi:MAG: Gfo/Idh/MocA family oxidoreductase [Planctomycetes bacterium]|nr:Gfo/Idh/MocA family oxidoreductase [Planctomycetota bacterium]